MMPLQKSKDLDEWKNHITTNVSIDGQTGCWIWKKATRKDGYGNALLKMKMIGGKGEVYDKMRILSF